MAAAIGRLRRVLGRRGMTAALVAVPFLLVVAALVALHCHSPDLLFGPAGAAGTPLLVAHATPAHGLCLRGWWQEHAPWHVGAHHSPAGSAEHRAHASQLVAHCKAQSHRAVFQNVFVRRRAAARFAAIQLLIGAQVEAASSLKCSLPPEEHQGVRLLLKVADAVTTKILAEKSVHWMPNEDGSITPGYQQLELQLPPADYPETALHLLQIMVVAACAHCDGRLVLTHVQLWDGSEGLQPVLCPGLDLPPPRPKPMRTAKVLHQTTAQALAGKTVTLVTQMSLERLDNLVRIAEVWAEPIVAAIYMEAPGDSFGWPEKYVTKKMTRIFEVALCSACWTVVLVPTISTNVGIAKVAGVLYPVNYLRNIALGYVKTPWVWSLDADFLPSSSESIVRDVIASADYLSSHAVPTDTAALVVPVFDLPLADRNMLLTPKTKQELVAWIQSGEAEPFRQSQSPLSHQPVDYDRWMTTDEPYAITYTDKFEPYVIMRYRENMPLYDASFVGYGMNKIAYTMTLAAAGYHFHVLPSSWAIHLPHSESLESRQFVSGVDHRVANRLQRFRFLARLQADYGLEYCRDPSASADDIRWPC